MSLRRLFSTSLSRLGSGVPATQVPVSSLELPPAITRLIAKHLSPSSDSPTAIPNPFVTHRQASGSTTPMSIPRRRQRQLFERYPGSTLPPSPYHPGRSAATTSLIDPTFGEVSAVWEGETDIKTNKTLYGGRRLRFKGHKHEREKAGKEKEREDRMVGMEKRIKEWRKTKADTRASARPSLPF